MSGVLYTFFTDQDGGEVRLWRPVYWPKGACGDIVRAVGRRQKFYGIQYRELKAAGSGTVWVGPDSAEILQEGDPRFALFDRC